MGLDCVNIIVGWEQALGVTITEAEAVGIRTPALAIALLASKLNATDSRDGACLTLRAFNRIRRGLVSGAGVRRADVTPRAKLRKLLPHAQRHSRWHAVQIASGLPALQSPGFAFGPSTVAELVDWLLSASPTSLKHASEPWTRDDIRTVVRAVVTDVSGARDFSDDDDFIKDIGLD